MKKILPKDITAQDFIKCLAVLLMVTDHIGHHFYPDDMWFRVLGRLCIPIWFFLIGYARTQERPLTLWSAAILVQLSSLISGQYLLPLNILFTILIMRTFRQGFIRNALHSPESMRGVFLILLLSTLPSGLIFEYGSFGMLFVIIGYIVRHKAEVMERIAPKYVMLFMGLSYFAFFIMQGAGLPSLSIMQAMVLAVGLILVAVTLWNFEAQTFPAWTKKLPRPATWCVKIMGRKTLEIYILHLLLFRAICMVLYPEKYEFMNWGWLPASLMKGII